MDAREQPYDPPYNRDHDAGQAGGSRTDELQRVSLPTLSQSQDSPRPSNSDRPYRKTGELQQATGAATSSYFQDDPRADICDRCRKSTAQCARCRTT